MGLDVIAGICSQIDQIAEHVRNKYPEHMYMVDVQKAYWEDVRDAHKNGKKLAFFSGPCPIEILYAFDMIPFFLDMLPTRIASVPGITARFIEAAEKYVTPSMCNINKVELGTALLDDFGVTPDVFVYTTIPCESARLAMPIVDDIFGVPSYILDIPFKNDERSYQYLADQYPGLIKFLEEQTGQKLDLDKLKGYMEESNRSYEYLIKIADLRKLKPCPLAGKLLILNEIIAPFSPHPASTKYFKKQYEIGLENANKGIGAIPEEKYRVSWLQNMVWASAGLVDWLERKFGAMLVMDGFGYHDGLMFENMNDLNEIYLTLARKALSVPMIHGASGPTSNFVKIIDGIMDQYSVDVSMFIGHIGCKHTWASAKIVTDMVQEKYGLPTLFLEVDAVDGRYKSVDELKANITEYMETVVMKQTV